MSYRANERGGTSYKNWRLGNSHMEFNPHVGVENSVLDHIIDEGMDDMMDAFFKCRIGHAYVISNSESIL